MKPMTTPTPQAWPQSAIAELRAEVETLRLAPEKLADCGNTPYDEGPFTLATPPSAAQAEGASDIDPNEADPGILWSEIIRLRAAIQGPDGFASWQDAATAERIRRVRAEKELAALTAAPEKLEGQTWDDANDAATADVLRTLLRREPTLKEITDVQKAVCSAAPHQQAAQPVAFPFRIGSRKLLRRGHAQGLLRELGKWMQRDSVGDAEAVELVGAYIDALEQAAQPEKLEPLNGMTKEAAMAWLDGLKQQAPVPKKLAPVPQQAAQGGREGLTKITRAIARLRPAVTGNGELAIAHRAGFSAAKQAAVEAVRGITTPAGDSE